MALSTVRVLDPASLSANSTKRGFRRALNLFREASERVPAYRDFLRRAKIRPGSIRTEADFANVPLTDKPNYISRYALEELSWDGDLSSSRYVSTSSGSTGIPFFWPRGVRQDEVLGLMCRNIYERIFDTKKGATLFVDSYAMGTWIAGLEFYNATKWVAEKGSRIVISTPSIDKTEAIIQIKKLAPSFDRIVIGGYPPFVKDILESGAVSGISWRAIDLRLLVAGEAVSELWRDRVLGMIGKNGDYKSFVNVYGMADSGVVAHETPLSVLLRRSLKNIFSAVPGLPAYESVTGLYQFYPLARYFEAVPGGSLVLTSDAGLPLVRYDTRDTGGILDYSEVIALGGKELRGEARKARVDLAGWKLPFVYLNGRKDLSISLYALNIYVENIKYALERSKHAASLSGLFIMAVEYTEKQDQRFALTVELASGVEPSARLRDAVVEDVVANLCRLNTEYARLHDSLGKHAEPAITLVRFGEIQTVPGKKHKWVKRGR